MTPAGVEEPVRGHRRVTRAGRWAGRATAAGLVLAALVVGGALNAHRPGTDQREEPFVRTGAPGTRIDARTFGATVLGVRGGTKVTSGGQAHDTSGIWVLAKVRLEAVARPLAIGFAALVDGQGREYYATDRVDQRLASGSRLLEPGIPVTGEIVFEVPLSVATSLRLRLAERPTDQRMDAMAQCPLPVDGALLARWKAQSQPLVPTDPQTDG